MTTQQLTIADAVAARDAALDRLGRGREAEWVEDAALMLRAYLERHDELHVDDWWDYALDRDLGTPAEARSLGVVFRSAARANWMMKSGRSKPSKRSNGSDKPVWRSLIYTRGE